MSLEYYDEAIKELKKRIADKNIYTYMMTIVSVCELIVGLEKLVNKEFAMAVLSLVCAIISFVLTALMFKDISEMVEKKIDFLKKMYDIDQRYKNLEKKAFEEEKEMLQKRVLELARKAGYKKCITLDEILEEVNGDTKECECELEQGDTMS